jgi:hypothetical protein
MYLNLKYLFRIKVRIGAIWRGMLGVLSTLIFEISSPKCVYVYSHLNNHY